MFLINFAVQSIGKLWIKVSTEKKRSNEEVIFVFRLLWSHYIFFVELCFVNSARYLQLSRQILFGKYTKWCIVKWCQGMIKLKYFRIIFVGHWLIELFVYLLQNNIFPQISYSYDFRGCCGYNTPIPRTYTLNERIVFFLLSVRPYIILPSCVYTNYLKTTLEAHDAIQNPRNFNNTIDFYYMKVN